MRNPKLRILEGAKIAENGYITYAAFCSITSEKRTSNKTIFKYIRNRDNTTTKSAEFNLTLYAILIVVSIDFVSNSQGRNLGCSVYSAKTSSFTSTQGIGLERERLRNLTASLTLSFSIVQFLTNYDVTNRKQ